MAAIKHFLQFNDLSTDELNHIFARAKWIKGQFKNYKQYWPLQDRSLVMIFKLAFYPSGARKDMIKLFSA